MAPRIPPKAALALAAALALGGAFFFFGRKTAAPGLSATCPGAVHYSYFSTPPVFDAAYAEAGSQAPEPDLKGLIVPHHLLAAKFIAEAFGKIATDRAVTVVLISPNHFSAGTGKIIASAASWQTPYGTLAGDCGAVEALKSAGAATVEEEPFAKEHGISGIVPFIRRSLPHARVVPVIVRQDASDADLANFARAAEKAFGPDTLFVGSFDFSHGLTDVAAQFHDRKALAVVDGFDDAGARVLDIDSPPGLRLTLRLLDQAGATRFSLLEGSNSARLLKQPASEDVTSYLVGGFAAGAKTPDDDVTLLAFGDLMLDRGVADAVRTRGPSYPFQAADRLYAGSDLVTANAEGVFVSATGAKETDPRPRFAFDPGLLRVLKAVGFTHLGEANNHALDFGRAQLDASRAAMRQAGIGMFGDPSNAGNLAAVTTARGRNIVQIGYDQFGGHGPDETLDAVAAARKEGAFTVVYAHWGVEFDSRQTKVQTALAHAFIEAGADVVIGAHPHVIQPIEVYKGKAIFYSLGNFIFDQPADGPTGQGLALGIADDAHGTTFYLMPISTRGAQASLMASPKRSTLLKTLAAASDAPEDIKRRISDGIFTLESSP